MLKHQIKFVQFHNMIRMPKVHSKSKFKRKNIETNKDKLCFNPIVQ